jgi:hypothetical protein
MQVNKSELAQILGCSLPTIAAYITRYGDDFPVLKRGGLGQDWIFDHEAVTSFLDRKRSEELEADADRRAALRQYALPIGHNGGPSIDGDLAMKPTDLLALAKLRKLQRDEAYECGRLVVASEVTRVIGEALRLWSQRLQECVGRFSVAHELSEQDAADLERDLTDCQRGFVIAMAAKFRDKSADQAALSFENAA